MKSIIYVGLDVHKETISACCYTIEEQRYFADSKFETNIENIEKYLKAIKKAFKEDEIEFRCGYEAGGLGYSLYNQMESKGINCVIIAPSTIAKSSGEKKHKTDRRDARLLARTLAYGTFKRVHVPTKEDEEVKDYIRMRNGIKKLLKEAKQFLLAYLLRKGKKYDKTTYWTDGHIKRNRGLTIPKRLQVHLS